MSDNLEFSLFQNWDRTLKNLGVKSAFSLTLYNELVSAYSSPGRYYHNLNHIKFGLDLLDELYASHPARDMIALAFWYHDFVYDPKAKDNEERSAFIAEDRISRRLNLDGVFAKKVGILIEMTQHSKAPVCEEGAILCDIDLAILGSTIEQYQQFELAIRKEYSVYPDDIFYSGRLKVLKTFLRKNIFWTYAMHYTYSSQAKENLTRAIAFLEPFYGHLENPTC